MDAAASLLNDTAMSTYPYSIQMPYLNMALRELQELFELNEVPVTASTSAVIAVPANTDEIGFAPTPPIINTPYLPDDLIEPSILWERNHNIDPYVPMTRWDFLPLTQSGVEINQFIGYVWQSNKIVLLPANQANDIKMNYIKSLFAVVTTSTTQLSVINAQSFLQYRTAGLVARYVEENVGRADQLDSSATLSLDRVNGIQAKGRQAIMTRHRPFRSSYKRNNYN